MEILIKLLICQLIIKDFIDLSFIWKTNNYILNILSLSLCLILLLFDYYKLSINYFRIALLALCIINCEIPFQQTVNYSNIPYFTYACLLQFIFNKQHFSISLITHLQLLYISVRAIFASSTFDIHSILLILLLQPINHAIIMALRQKHISQQTQTITVHDVYQKQTDQLLSSESRRECLKNDLDESIIIKFLNDKIESPQQEHKSTSNNRNKLDQRVIIKKQPINVLKTTTLSSDYNNVEPPKLETHYSEIVSILNNLPFGILFVDETLKILDLNQRVTQLLGISNTNEIIKFLDEAIRSGEFCEFRSSKKIRKRNKTQSKNTILKQPSISPQKKYLDEYFQDVASIYNQNNISQFRGDSECNENPNLKSIFQRFKKIHQSQITSFSRETFQYIIRMDNMNTSNQKSKYRSLKLKIFQLESFGKWDQAVYLFLLENITKREEYKLLNHKYKFQQALLNSLCHELRTPINGTVSQLYALRDELSSSLIDSHLDPAIVSAKRLQYQLNDILDYAQIQCSALVLNKQCFNLHEVFDQLKYLFSFECIQKQINLIIDDVTDIELYSDKERLTRILINLLDNSVKFTNQGGTISVHCKIYPHYYQFNVNDDGQGITEEVIEKIGEQAEMLFQDSIQYNSNKLGLGLRISQQLAKYLYKDQKFEINSEYGQFTKVSFRLSKRIENCSKEFELDKNITNCKLECECSKILIVDDISCNHFALQVLLKRFKLKTDSAYNGNSAIELVTKRQQQQCCQTYRLIFMDIEMPGKNGFQASSEITNILKQFNLNQQCIIVMYSAYSGDDDILVANQCGMKERISKPTEIQKLEYLIKKYIL